MNDWEGKFQRKISVCKANETGSDEVKKAQTAKPSEDTIFGKIARKEIPVDFLYEDEQVRIALFNLFEISVDNLVRCFPWCEQTSAQTFPSDSERTNPAIISLLSNAWKSRCSLFSFDFTNRKLTFEVTRTSINRRITSGKKARSCRRWLPGGD